MTLRERRALLVGGSVVVAAVIVLRVLPWAVSHVVSARADLHGRATLLAHARQDLAQTTELRDSVARITQAVVALAPKLLTGSTAEEAGADLSARLNLIATRNATTLQRVDVLADSSRVGRLGRARVRAALETDIRGLAGVLRTIAGSDAALTVVELQIVAQDPASTARQPEILKVEATVTGWYLKPR